MTNSVKLSILPRLQNPRKCTDHVIILELAGGPDRVEDSVVDDRVHGERHTVRGEDLLGRNLEDLSPGVYPLDLLQEGEDEYEAGTSDDGLMKTT